MERILTLHFIDGSKMSFEFDAQSDNPAGRKMRLADFMTSQHLVIEAEGSVLVFPVTNIKYMSLSIASLDADTANALPLHAITGARIRL